jgi:predicted TIM-barrel fold metal-dependent hydrolase
LAELSPPPPDPTPIPGSLAAIDIHCHFFNASDLPIDGFCRDVVLSLPDSALSIAPDALILLLSTVLKVQSVSARQEANEIRSGARAAERVQLLSDDDLFRDRVGAAIRKLQNVPLNAPAASTERAAPRPLLTPAISKKLQSAFRHYGAIGRAKARGLAPQGAVVPGGSFSPEEVTEGILSSGGAVYGALWLGSLLTLSRLELTHRLVTLPPREADAGEVRFFAPAIIDYSYWLHDFDVSPHQDQIDVMSAIAAIRGRQYGVHAWASYCPWRHIVDKHQLERIQTAIATGGLLGAKLYPVMGFYPIGNEAAAARGEPYPRDLAKEPNFGKQLDDNLRELYSWCSRDGVPILTHCSFSQYPDTPTKDVGLRAAPEGWAEVLKQYPTLRLDIGHMGGLWQIPVSAPKRPPGRPWTERVIEILDNPKFDFVSADVADYATILERDKNEKADDKEALMAVKGWLAAHGRARNRIMYGTDWSMLAQYHPGDLDYYQQMKTRWPEKLGLTDDEKRNYLGANAARLIGLSKIQGNTPHTRQRLEAFYKANQLDPTILSRWDSNE